MKYIEGKVWSVKIEYVGPMAGKTSKLVYVMAPTVEKAIGYVKEAISINGQVTSAYQVDAYDGVVSE